LASYTGQLDGRVTSLTHQVSSLERRFAGFEHTVNDRFTSLESNIASLRSDFSRLESCFANWPTVLRDMMRDEIKPLVAGHESNREACRAGFAGVADGFRIVAEGSSYGLEAAESAARHISQGGASLPASSPT
jgi:hypothetical protein